MTSMLPPGPKAPSLVQTVGWWNRPTAYLERLRARHGTRFTLRLLGQPPFVVLTDPDEIRQVLTAPPDVLHPGEGARLLEPVVGTHSVILLDEAPHLEQRRLLLPAFHGDRVQRLTDLMAELTERELDRWPAGEPVALHPRLQALTLEIILRAVFGLDEGERLEALRPRLTAMLTFGDSPLSLLPAARGLPLLRRRFARFMRDREEADRLLFGLMDERRAEGAPPRAEGASPHDGREDVLAMLLAARHEDGSPMGDGEIRDELLTALVAGHETTASSLAFAFEELAHVPEWQSGLDDEDRLGAVVNEVLRHKPVLPNPEPRLVKRAIEIGGVRYEPGVVLICSAHLVHHDPALYPDPYAFRPQRWLGARPGTYTFLPWGGGRRRCLGASFALLEMRVVLRAALERFAVRPADGGREPVRRRMITITPARGATVVLEPRTRSRDVPLAGTAAA